MTIVLCSYCAFRSDSEDENQGNDYLFIVIGDIIVYHNLVIENLYSAVQENKELPLNRLLSERPSMIFPLEVTSSHAIVGSFSK